VDSELEVIRTEMEATRGSLAQKISELETQVRDTVTEASDAVSATKEGVKEVVSSVSDTVTSVKDSLTDTVTSVKDSLTETFNLSKHVEENPWAAFGIAVAVGAAGGMFLPAPHVPLTSGFAPGATASPPPSSIPAAAAAATAASGAAGMFGSVFAKLQSLAVQSMVDVAQDLIRQSAPEPWRDGLQDIVRDLASQLTDGKSSTGSRTSSNGSY